MVVTTVDFNTICRSGDNVRAAPTSDKSTFVVRFFIYDLLQFGIERLWLVDYVDDNGYLPFSGDYVRVLCQNFTMESFDSIFQRAAERKGGEDVLLALLPKPKTSAALKRTKDGTYLAEMTKCVFRSGFVWKIIENKWPGFEEAFHHFDVATCAMMSDEEQETLSCDQVLKATCTCCCAFLLVGSLSTTFSFTSAFTTSFENIGVSLPTKRRK